MNYQQSQYLIQLPKKIIEHNQVLTHKDIVFKVPFAERYELLSEEDKDYSFLIKVYQSGKNLLKISLHCQEDSTNYGLLRVDYGQRHLNPMTINEHVPDICHPYTGQWITTGHIHIAVEGYPSLAWAVPLEVDTFPIKEIASVTEISEAFSSFFKRINVKTTLAIAVVDEAFL